MEGGLPSLCSYPLTRKGLPQIPYQKISPYPDLDQDLSLAHHAKDKEAPGSS